MTDCKACRFLADATTGTAGFCTKTTSNANIIGIVDLTIPRDCIFFKEKK